MARQLRTTLSAGVPTHRELTAFGQLRAVELFRRCRDTCSQPIEGGWLSIVELPMDPAELPHKQAA